MAEREDKEQPRLSAAGQATKLTSDDGRKETDSHPASLEQYYKHQGQLPEKIKRTNRPNFPAPLNTIEYEVRERDTLMSIAVHFGVTESELRTINKTTSSIIFSGQILYVPGPDHQLHAESTINATPAKKEPDNTINTSQVKSVTKTELSQAIPSAPLSISLPTALHRSSVDELSSASKPVENAEVVKNQESNNLTSRSNTQLQIPVSSSSSIIPIERSLSAPTVNDPLNEHDIHSDSLVRVKATYLAQSIGQADGTLSITPDHVAFTPNKSSPAKLDPAFNLFFELEDMLEPVVMAAPTSHIPGTLAVIALKQTVIFGVPESPSSVTTYLFSVDADSVDSIVAFFMTHLDEARDRASEAKAHVRAKHRQHHISVPTHSASPIIIPRFTHSSDLLSAHEIQEILRHAPPSQRQCVWNRTFCTKDDGFNINTFYRNFKDFLERPAVLVFHEIGGARFGAYTPCGWKVSDGYYGSGESFLFKCDPVLKVFAWTGFNRFFMNGNKESIAMGGGDRGSMFSLWADSSFYRGSSYRSQTYDNEPLASKSDFTIESVEAWSLLSSGF